MQEHYSSSVLPLLEFRYRHNLLLPLREGSVVGGLNQSNSRILFASCFESFAREQIRESVGIDTHSKLHVAARRNPFLDYAHSPALFPERLDTPLSGPRDHRF